MQIVIDIPKEYYEEIENMPHFKRNYAQDLILDGTPLPKGHGKLIDADAFYNDLIFPNVLFAKSFKEMLDDAATIIPAESEDE